MKTLEELGSLCDRAANRLYGEPPDRDGMFDVATVLSFVSHYVERHLHRAGVWGEWGSWLFAVDLGITACKRRLKWLREDAPSLADEVIVRTVDRILHVLVRIIAVLTRHLDRSLQAT